MGLSFFVRGGFGSSALLALGIACGFVDGQACGGNGLRRATRSKDHEQKYKFSQNARATATRAGTCTLLILRPDYKRSAKNSTHLLFARSSAAISLPFPFRLLLVVAGAEAEAVFAVGWLAVDRVLCLPEEDEAISVLVAALALVLDLSVLAGVLVFSVLLFRICAVLLVVVAVDADG